MTGGVRPAGTGEATGPARSPARPRPPALGLLAAALAVPAVVLAVPGAVAVPFRARALTAAVQVPPAAPSAPSGTGIAGAAGAGGAAVEPPAGSPAPRGTVRDPLPDRDRARQQARQELSRAEYREQRPGPVQRLIAWFLDRLAQLPAPRTPASAWALGLIVVALLVLAGAALRITGGPRRVAAGSRQEAIFDAGPATARDHRLAARRAAEELDWRTAVLERFRALLRELEERAVLDPRPSRTADEAAREAGALLPELLGALLTAARTFDDVRYGDQPATPAMEAGMRELDGSVRSARPVAGPDAAGRAAVPA